MGFSSVVEIDHQVTTALGSHEWTPSKMCSHLRLCETQRCYTKLQKQAIATTAAERINASTYLLRWIHSAKATFPFFLPFWTEWKTSSTWFNRVSLCIIVPKVAVFLFLAFLCQYNSISVAKPNICSMAFASKLSCSMGKRGLLSAARTRQ